MKFSNKFNVLKRWTLMSLVLFVITSCDDNEEQDFFSPGSRLVIVGADEVKVGDLDVQYFVQNNTLDKDYTWTLGQLATLQEDSFNDAFAYLSFSALGQLQLQTNNGTATGSKIIEVTSREVGFTVDSLQTMESLVNDTISVPLSVSGGLGGNVEIAYTISGTLDPSQYDILPGFESPITLNRDGEAEIMMVLKPETNLDAGNIILTIDNITPTLSDEYVLTSSTELRSIQYWIMNDFKEVSIDTTTLALDSAEGVFSYPILLSNPSSSEIAVSYEITASGPGVRDATATSTLGTLVFSPGETGKDITLSIDISAFASDQAITISITGITGPDAEARLSERIEKVIEIDVN